MAKLSEIAKRLLESSIDHEERIKQKEEHMLFKKFDPRRPPYLFSS
jgi:hypothetical protein